LNAVDPERAAQIHPHDTYRINRALHIWHTTGNKPSTYAPLFKAPRDFMLIFLTRNRAELYDRINKRVKLMVDEGWPAECAALRGTPWESFVCTKGIIGYKEMMAVVSGESSLEEAVPRIAQDTRHYAKRQHIFWRMMQKKITDQADRQYILEEANLTLLDLDLYISQLSHIMKSFYI
jgi:tRNA dimethylallyltransferase